MPCPGCVWEWAALGLVHGLGTGVSWELGGGDGPWSGMSCCVSPLVSVGLNLAPWLIWLAVKLVPGSVSVRPCPVWFCSSVFPELTSYISRPFWQHARPFCMAAPSFSPSLSREFHKQLGCYVRFFCQFPPCSCLPPLFPVRGFYLP